MKKKFLKLISELLPQKCQHGYLLERWEAVSSFCGFFEDNVAMPNNLLTSRVSLDGDTALNLPHRISNTQQIDTLC